jgi:hypothetical protein
MKSKSVTFKHAVVAVAMTLVFSQAVVNAQEPPVMPRGFSIVGTWNLETTFVDCASGAPLLPPGRSLVSYVDGGTYIEEAVGTPPSFRYPGLGVWRHLNGRHYALAFKILQFNADGTSNGKIVVVADTEHNLDDTLTSAAVARIFNAAGNLVATRCVKVTGTRFTGEE